MSLSKLICFDCDSTLSAIEGIDELARLRSPECFRRIEQMTNHAMEGRIPLDEVFGRRLEIIRPTRADADRVGRMYVERVEPTAAATLQELRAGGWTTVIVSGGFTQLIRPLADLLGVDRVEAVALKFDAAGNYAGYDTAHPASRRGGKGELVRRLKAEFAAARSVMVGDGASDLEARDEVDLFVGFGRYAERAKVKVGAHHFIYSLSDLPGLLDR